jgi:hypothetical protein
MLSYYFKKSWISLSMGAFISIAVRNILSNLQVFETLEISYNHSDTIPIQI